MVVLSFLTEEDILCGITSAASTLIMLPPMVLVLLAHRNLAKGLTMGAVKG